MKTTRRSWMIQASLAALAATVAITATFLPSRTASATPAPADEPITIGFIYVGSRSDYGYNQAQSEGAKEVAKLPGVKILEEENVPETVAVQKTMESMIVQDGAKVIFPTSFGYFDPHML